MAELYKKHRPQDFDQIVGNKSVISSLQSKIKNGDLPHFMVFAGPPGCGKTTISRILKEKLEVRDLDFREINAATDNGVDVARDIAEKCRYKPFKPGKNRLWLFDEAHRLTPQCLAAMLKTLEDTPEHAYFIFATSEHQKLSEAIKSRATIYTMKPLNDAEMQGLLTDIAEKEGFEIPEPVLEKIITVSLGQSRNALVALDAIKSLPPKKMLEAVERAAQEESKCYDLLKALLWGNGTWKSIATILENFEEDPEQTRRYLMTAACNQLKSPDKERSHDAAFQLAYSMKNPFYNNGFNDLVFACRDFWVEVYGK